MILRARYFLNERFEPASGESIRIEGERIVERGRYLAPRAEETVIDLGDALVMPGWINAHCHLELGRLRGALPRGIGFVPWVRELVDKRRGQDEAFFVDGIRSGIEEATSTGTTTLCDVTTTGLTADHLDGCGIVVHVFEEAIAFDPARAASTAEAIRGRGERIALGEPHRRRGVAPHAPYTVSAELFRELARIAADAGVPSSVHLSETPDEIRMFDTGDGELFDFLDGLGEIPAGWTPPGTTPTAWLDTVGYLAVRPMLVHANYLADDDIERIRRSGSAVVFCPRSHRFFGHSDHPYPRLVRAGIPVAFGTDSLASNDSLDMRDEVREVLRQFPELAPLEALASAYEGAARALGLSGQIGRVAVGARADVIAYELRSASSEASALEAVLDSPDLPELVMAGGQVLRGPDRSIQATQGARP